MSDLNANKPIWVVESTWDADHSEVKKTENNKAGTKTAPPTTGAMNGKTYQVVILTSGSGTNMEAVVKYSLDHKDCPYSVTKVLADRPCGALTRAQGFNLPRVELDRKVETFQEELLEEVKGADIIVLAGFLSILSPGFIRAFPDRILNIHPSLLPKFGGLGMHGLYVHEAVIAQGETESGCSCHLVTEQVDEGKVMVQKKVPVLSGDSALDLRDRILPLEHLCLVEGILELISQLDNHPTFHVGTMSELGE